MKSVVAYLNFDGNCREAMTFYAKCLGAELIVMPFSDMPGEYGKATPDRVLHASLQKPSGSILMASDTMPGTPHKTGGNFSVSVHCESVEEINQLFVALGENGKISMPLDDAFWGARFGTLTDQFGIPWMLNYEYPKK